MRKSNSLVAAIISLFVFLVLYIDIAFIGLVEGFDRAVSEFSFGSFFNSLAIFFDVLLGNVAFLIFTVILVGFLFYKKRAGDGVFSGLVLILGAAFGYLIKLLVSRARPENLVEEGLSFPSGHALKATLLFLVLIYLFKNKIKDGVMRNIFVSLSVVLILLIGLSRLVLGVHWFSDIIAGFALGTFLVYLGLVLRGR